MLEKKGRQELPLPRVRSSFWLFSLPARQSPRHHGQSRLNVPKARPELELQNVVPSSGRSRCRHSTILKSSRRDWRKCLKATRQKGAERRKHRCKAVNRERPGRCGVSGGNRVTLGCWKVRDQDGHVHLAVGGTVSRDRVQHTSSCRVPQPALNVREHRDSTSSVSHSNTRLRVHRAGAGWSNCVTADDIARCDGGCRQAVYVA